LKKKEALRIIVNYFNSEATEDEVAALEKWLQKNNNKHYFKEAFKTECYLKRKLIEHKNDKINF
jgi:hypothetical protein